MVGWHHRVNELELEQAPGVGDGQGGLVCCSLWGHKESDMTGLKLSDCTELKSLPILFNFKKKNAFGFINLFSPRPALFFSGSISA